MLLSISVKSLLFSCTFSISTKTSYKIASKNIWSAKILSVKLTLLFISVSINLRANLLLLVNFEFCSTEKMHPTETECGMATAKFNAWRVLVEMSERVKKRIRKNNNLRKFQLIDF